MMKRQGISLAFAMLALSNYAVAAGLNLGHHKKEAEVAVSGVRQEVAVSGARSIEQKRTKHDALKQALGLGGSVVAASVPSGCQSAFEVVKDNENFSFLKNMIVATGLESLLSDPALVATIFAPDDEAVSAGLEELEISPQELFDDVVTLSIVLKYHIIPGLSLQLEKTDGQISFMDSQPYFTLLTDKHKNRYTVEFDLNKEIDLKELKVEGSLAKATSREYFIIPSGGPPAEITKFDINAGCPTVIHAIDNVLIPDYKDVILADAGNIAIDILSTYEEAGAPLPTLPGVARP